MPDLLFQNLSTVQSNLQPTPTTLASAATVSPSTRLTIVTGTTAIATIVPPVSGYHELAMVFTNAAPAAFLTTGNVLTAVAPVTNVPSEFFFNPLTGKYFGK
jgi:hypothetical protein